MGRTQYLFILLIGFFICLFTRWLYKSFIPGCFGRILSITSTIGAIVFIIAFFIMLIKG